MKKELLVIVNHQRHGEKIDLFQVVQVLHPHMEGKIREFGFRNFDIETFFDALGKIER